MAKRTNKYETDQTDQPDQNKENDGMKDNKPVTKGMTIEKEVGLWHERINLGKKDLEDWAQSSGAKRFVNMYKGKYDIYFHTRSRKVPVPPINEVFAYVQSDIAATYNRDPHITVNAKAGSPRGARIWEMKLNYLWRELKIKEENEKEIIDKDLVGFGWNKTGYSPQSTGTGDELKIENEKYYSKYVNWRDVITPAGCYAIPEECDWMAQRIVWPLRRIKNKFKNGKKVKGAPDPRIDRDSYKSLKYKDDASVGVFYEIWDAIDKKIRYIAEGLEDMYLDDPKEWPEYLDEFPFHMYWDFVNPESRPMSAIAPWEHQILEEMVLLAQAVNHGKRWSRQLFVRGGSVDETALDKFERGDDGAVITVNAPMEDGSFKFADFGQLPTDFYLLMDRLQSIKRNIHGQPEFSRGGVTKTGTRTIGELQLMEKGAKGREERKIDRLETHLENIARHLMAHCKANFDLEEIVKITGKLPEEVINDLGDAYNPMTGELRITEDDIKGEYDVEIKSGSTLPVNKEMRTRIYETVLTSLGPVADQASLNPFINAIVQGLLEDFDVKAIEDAYKEMRQQAIQKAQDEANRRDVEEEKTMAEADKRAAQAEKVRAETQKELQEAAIGPHGRTLMKRAEKPGPGKGINGLTDRGGQNGI